MLVGRVVSTSYVAVLPPERKREVADAVRALTKERSVPKIEERLIEIEHELIDAIVRTLPDPDSFRREVLASLGDTSKLDEKTRRRTEDANLRRVVRAKFGIPRLTLF